MNLNRLGVDVGCRPQVLLLHIKIPRIECLLFRKEKALSINGKGSKYLLNLFGNTLPELKFHLGSLQ